MPTAQEAPAEEFAIGVPVELGEIDRELKKLWEANEGCATRASLINLAVYSEAPDSLARNTAIISRLTENHACRAIVIAADAADHESGVEAWVSAHCHISRSGSKQICSEQLSFFLRGESSRLLPNILFSRLDSDLPLYLWWQEEFHAPMDPQLWAWVDRLIYDSQNWRDFGEQLALVRTAQEEARQRIVLCDLNWVRLVQYRLALAQFFDHPATHHYLEEIEALEVRHGAGFRSTALLLVGWFAGQLRWELEQQGGNSFTFLRQVGDEKRKIAVSLREGEAAPIARCTITTKVGKFQAARKPGTEFLDVSFKRKDGREMHQVLPAGHNDPVDLLREELMRGGRHQVYLRAIEQIRGLV